jgi:hypothetical protein
MKEIRTQIEITAPVEKVWSVLMNFEGYSEWNPFISSITGDAILGARLVVNLQPPGQSKMTFEPEVVAFRKGELFAWKGKLFVKGIFDGKHIFELERTDTGCILTHREEFTGLLVGLVLSKVGESTLKGFTEMNLALKTRAEA